MKKRNENVQQVANTVLKAAIEAVPFIGGSLNVLFEHRSKLKQQRINEFVIGLSEYLQNIRETDVSLAYVESDEFGDMFEGVLKRVALTSSEAKIKRFKSILANQVKGNTQSDYTETFLDLTTYLSDKQIDILAIHSQIDKSIEGYYEQIPHIEQEIENLQTVLIKERNLSQKGFANDFTRIDESIKRKKGVLAKQRAAIGLVSQFRNHEYYEIGERDYLILVQDLVGKSLLVDIGLPVLGVLPFHILAITEFGREYLGFVATSNQQKGNSEKISLI